MTLALAERHAAAGAVIADFGADRLVMRFGDPLEEVAAAHRVGARFDRSFRPRLRVTGADHRDFLQRMSTADIAALGPGRGAPTLFLERTGRLVDRLAALCFEDGILLVGNRERGPFAREWIERYVIAERVDVRDATPETFLFTLVGPEAPGALRDAYSLDVDSWEPWTHSFASASSSSSQVVVARAEDVGGRSWFVIGPSSLASETWDALAALPSAGEEAYRALRIESGVPAFGEEYTDRSIPLETRMHDAISFRKGCYLGQEVIARLHNYQRVKRWLVRLWIEGTELPGDGATIRAEGAEIGTITSAVPTADGVVALGFVERERAESPAITVTDGSENRAARILPLHPSGDPS